MELCEYSPVDDLPEKPKIFDCLSKLRQREISLRVRRAFDSQKISDDDTRENMCYSYAQLILKVAKEIGGVKASLISIHDLNMARGVSPGDTITHFAVLIKDGSSVYLHDPTFRQFVNGEQMGQTGWIGRPLPPDDLMVLRLRGRGWLRIDEAGFKHYLDLMSRGAVDGQEVDLPTFI